MKHLPFFQKFKIPFLLFLFCLITYFPLSSFLFALKNDAFIYNFPNKHFFSEALHFGYIPTWNPYLNFGFPLYADPGFAWWHPITWIFGFIGYTPFTLSIEVLTYIYIAGLGMYWLIKKLQFSTYTAFATGCMFMGSGFFIGNLQHINFISCAAFLPWLIGFWLLYQQNANTKNLLGCCISVYLLCTGGHPAIPIASAFFIIILSLLYFLFYKLNETPRSFLLNQLKLLSCIVLILMPLIFSYSNLLPLYSRSETVNHSINNYTGFTIPSYLSFLLPFATIKNTDFFGTDVSMRNAYFSLLGLLCFLLFLIRGQKERIQIIFFIAGLLMLLLSLGGDAKEILYQKLPGFTFIRTNGEFRVFSIFSFLICGTYVLEKLFNKDVSTAIQFKRLLQYLLLLNLFICTFLLIRDKIFYIPFYGGNLVANIKNIIDHISFIQSIVVASIVAIVILSFYFIGFNTQHFQKKLILVLLVDIIVNSWLLLPITGVGKNSPRTIQTVINKAPKGFYYTFSSNYISPVNLSNEEKTLIGDWSWYNKNIVHPRIDYPSQLKTTDRFYRSADTIQVFNKKPFFLKRADSTQIHIISFNPITIELKLQVSEPDTLIILQNYYPGWKVEKNKENVPILSYLSTFMAIPVKEGENKIKLNFSPFR